MEFRARIPAALGALIIALFCTVSVYNQFRIADTVMAMSPASGRMSQQMRLALGWSAAVTTLSHLGLCFILAMLMIGVARLQTIALSARSAVFVIGVSHLPLLAWAVYGTVLFANGFDREHLELFGASVGRLMLARPFAYLGGVIWLVLLSAWELCIGMRQAVTLVVPPVLAIWAVLSILGWVIDATPR